MEWKNLLYVLPRASCSYSIAATATGKPDLLPSLPVSLQKHFKTSPLFPDPLLIMADFTVVSCGSFVLAAAGRPAAGWARAPAPVPSMDNAVSLSPDLFQTGSGHFG